CLVRLIASADDNVASVVMQIFDANDPLIADDATREVLSALARNPRVLAGTDDGWFIERLEEFLPDEAETVYRLCREVTRTRAADLGSIQTAWSMHAANLT